MRLQRIKHRLPIAKWQPNWPAVRLEDLPPAMREIAEAVDLQAVVALVKAYGGSRIYVSSAFVPLGLNAKQAKQLCRYYAGDFLYIHHASTILKQQRNRALQQDRRKGLTLHQLSQRYGLSTETIREILSKLPRTNHKKIASVSAQHRVRSRRKTQSSLPGF